MPVINETGKQYGKLTVIKRVENNQRGDAQWLCKCECGKEVIIKGTSLRSGHTQSCGCLQKEKIKQIGINNTYNLIGQQFGKLTVIERVFEEKGKWKCICECGGETITTTDKLLSGHTQSCGCLQSKGELLISNFLIEHNISFSKEFIFSDLKSNKGFPLRFDFAVFKNNSLLCLIEFDGIQHYDSNNIFWSQELEINDKKKNQYCQNNNYQLYRIKYNDNLEEKLNTILKQENN